MLALAASPLYLRSSDCFRLVLAHSPTTTRPTRPWFLLCVLFAASGSRFGCPSPRVARVHTVCSHLGPLVWGCWVRVDLKSFLGNLSISYNNIEEQMVRNKGFLSLGSSAMMFCTDYASAFCVNRPGKRSNRTSCVVQYADI